jgi:hypothetical protein
MYDHGMMSNAGASGLEAGAHKPVLPEVGSMHDVQKNMDEGIDIQEFLGWAEFCAWSALVMTPILWWLQGPSVSTDQFVVRTALVAIAATTGIALRIRALIQRIRSSPSRQAANDSAQRAEPTDARA